MQVCAQVLLFQTCVDVRFRLAQGWRTHARMQTHLVVDPRDMPLLKSTFRRVRNTPLISIIFRSAHTVMNINSNFFPTLYRWSLWEAYAVWLSIWIQVTGWYDESVLRHLMAMQSQICPSGQDVKQTRYCHQKTTAAKTSNEKNYQWKPEGTRLTAGPNTCLNTRTNFRHLNYGGRGIMGRENFPPMIPCVRVISGFLVWNHL